MSTKETTAGHTAGPWTVHGLAGGSRSLGEGERRSMSASISNPPFKTAPEGNPERLRASLRETRMEVGTGAPGYRWVAAWIAVSPDGTEFYPPYQNRSEAKAFLRERGWVCP